MYGHREAFDNPLIVELRQERTAGDPAKCTCPERIETAGGQVEASLWDSLAV